MAKKIAKITDPGTVIQSIFAEAAGVLRMAQAGMDLKPIGALTAAVRVGPGSPVMVYNSTGGVLYVKFGAQGVTAPTSASDGVPVLAGEKAMLNSGDQEWVIGSAVGLFGYTADL